MKTSAIYFVVISSMLILSACQPQPALPTIVPQTATSTPDIAPTQAPQPSATELPTATALPTEWPTATSGPTPNGGSEELIFSLEKRVNEGYQFEGVYLLKLLTRERTELYGAGYQLQDLSPDGRLILVNLGSELYLSDRYGGGRKLLSSSFYDMGTPAARWTEDGSMLLWIESAGDVTQVMRADSAGQDALPAEAVLQDHAVAIYASIDGEHILWAKGECSAFAICTQNFRVSALGSGETRELSNDQNPQPAWSGEWLAFLTQAETGFQLAVNSGINNDAPRLLDMGEDIAVDYEWSPDQNALLVLGQVRSDYSGKNFGNNLRLFSPPDWKAAILTSVDGINGRLDWSPDGQFFVVTTTEVNDSGYWIGMRLFNLTTGQLINFDDQLGLVSEDFLFVSRIFWVP